MQKSIIINSKEISLLKPITYADYESKTILTDSAWEYVELWLKRQKDVKSQEALFFWQKTFFSCFRMFTTKFQTADIVLLLYECSKSIIVYKWNQCY